MNNFRLHYQKHTVHGVVNKGVSHYALAMNKRKELIIIGEKIRQHRKEQGFSQGGFAAHVDISRAFYGRIERGHHNVSAMNLIKIAKALNIEVGCLFPNSSALKKIK